MTRRSFLATLSAVVASLGLRRACASPARPVVTMPEIPLPPTAEGEYVLTLVVNSKGPSFRWTAVAACA